MESDSIELLHSIQLDMLVKFDKICEENGLTYFLDSGTALGAVRHHGFIPWDDDVDVGMPREDYNKLLKLGEKGLPDNLFVQTYKNDPAYMMPFAKVRLGDTFFPEAAVDVRKMKYQGIYMDVFPFDRLPDNSRKAIRRVKQSRYWYYFSVYSRRDFPGIKRSQQIVARLLKKLPDNAVIRIHKFYDRFCSKYNSKNTNTWTCFCWRMSQQKMYFFENVDLFPTTKTKFEGKELSIMHTPHSYLTKMFGDYSKLPPENERKPHLSGFFSV